LIFGTGSLFAATVPHPSKNRYIEDIEAKANLAGLTLQEAQEFIDVFEKHMPEVADYIVIPSYVPANFKVETYGVDENRDKNFSISYIGPSNQCFLIYAFSGPAGGGPESIEIIPVVSKALGSTEVFYTEFDSRYNDSLIQLIDADGIIASPQKYYFQSPNGNCEAVDINEAVKIIESLIYLNL
jgi:hypothetical protein